jgi:hypothetical protein
MHDHQHSCECQHLNVKYCKTCEKAYCVDCGQTWPQYYWWNTVPYYTIPYVAPVYPTYTPYVIPQITWTVGDNVTS